MLLLAPFGALFTLSFIAPIIYAVFLSFGRVERDGPLGFGGTRTTFAGLDNYLQALQQLGFLESFGRVLLFGVVQVPVMLGLATILALILETLSGRWAGIFRASYFLPYGVPGVIASLLWGYLYIPGVSPIVDMFSALGISVDFFDHRTVLWSIANIVLWQFAGYNMLIIVAQLKAIPSELYESARIDGAGQVRIAWNVQLPLVRPALILATVFSIIGTLQLFAEPLVLQPLTTVISDDYTPNLVAYTEAFTKDNIHLASAMAVILTLIAGVLSFGFLRLVGRRFEE